MVSSLTLLLTSVIDQPTSFPVSGSLPDFVTQGPQTQIGDEKQKALERDQVKKKEQDEIDLTKIREKHAAEKASSRSVTLLDNFLALNIFHLAQYRPSKRR